MRGVEDYFDRLYLDQAIDGDRRGKAGRVVVGNGAVDVDGAGGGGNFGGDTGPTQRGIDGGRAVNRAEAVLVIHPVLRAVLAPAGVARIVLARGINQDLL